MLRAAWPCYGIREGEGVAVLGPLIGCCFRLVVRNRGESVVVEPASPSVEEGRVV